MKRPTKEAAVAALEAARTAAKLRQLDYTIHARERMPERRVQARDVQNAVLTATHATWRPDDRSWKVTGGKDLDGDSLDVAVVIGGNRVRVITVL